MHYSGAASSQEQTAILKAKFLIWGPYFRTANEGSVAVLNENELLRKAGDLKMGNNYFKVKHQTEVWFRRSKLTDLEI